MVIYCPVVARVTGGLARSGTCQGARARAGGRAGAHTRQEVGRSPKQLVLHPPVRAETEVPDYWFQSSNCAGGFASITDGLGGGGG